jgi:hypothetical protein
MTTLLLTVALLAPRGSEVASSASTPDHRATCSMALHALDDAGRKRSARRVSTGTAIAIVFQGRLDERHDKSDAAGLVFDVFTPSGHRYHELVAEPRVVVGERDGRRVRRVSKAREASLAVAGSSIAWTSMYGRWRVEPRIEGEDGPCGRAEYFTIGP